MPHRVCPPWIGVLLASPIRRLLQPAEPILAPYVREGMTALDVGSGMGHFTIPMARMVGPAGRVYCIDLQEKMLQGVRKRAKKAGLGERIETRLCTEDSAIQADLAGKMDFILAFAMVHEVAERGRLLADLAAMLAPTGRLLVAEPKGHVPAEHFAHTIAIAAKHGLKVAEKPRIRGSHSALLAKS